MLFGIFVPPASSSLLLRRPYDAFFQQSVNFFFPETDFLRLNKIGNLAAITELLTPKVEISAAPGTLIPSYIKEMRTVAHSVTRTFEVTLGFDSPKGMSIASGMTAKVIVQLPAGEAGRILVPASAVAGDSQGNSIVWVFDEASGTVNTRLVEVSEMTGGSIEIVSGLAEGDRIAILGAKNLREGMLVRPYDQ